MSDVLKVREEEISRLLMEQPVDLKALRKLSRSEGGFLNNQIRSRVWPKLLGVNRFDIPDYRSFIDPHRDDSQVKVDVERSLWKIDKTVGWREAYREDRRKALCDIIMAILCRNADLYYYQGFHDIVSVFLLVLEDDHIAFALCEVISRDFISDYMNCDFEVVGKSMKMLFVIIKASDSVLHRFLMNAGMEPFFATSWLLTWFAHDLVEISEAARLYDALLCSHPLFCYYLCAAFVIHLRKEILAAECDFAGVHDVLVRAPVQHGFPVDKIVSLADTLFERTPPDVLKKLCDPDVQKLIHYNQIASICKPHVFMNHIDSDWTILKGMRVKHTNGKNFYLERNYVDMMTFIGWNSAAAEVVDAAVHKHHSNVLHSGADSADGDSVGGKAGMDVGGGNIDGNTTTDSATNANNKDKTSKTSKANKKATSNTNNTSKPIFPFISSITGDNMSRNMFVVAIVIGLVSYSVRVFYSRS